ncbi:MAG: carboxypeptidase-like regulatory domain-containing protein [Verrucomicrobiales bacterium]|nr:carboxypeptidase-like regulatory domain-containing protein [Verrucomicrobiales bacterium]
MTSRWNRFVVLAAVSLLAVGTAAAQVATSGRLTGLVTDATQASVPGANVTVADESTGTTITTQTGADGSFTVGNLKPATYTVRVSSQGFKTQEYRNVKIEVGATYTLNASLEVGEVQSTVVVEAGAEVLKTSETAVATTITGKAIQQLPMTSRDALDLGTLMPGAQTTGRVRNTSFNGLPKGSINITYDGINAQDNINKSSDGFFTTIRPRVDSVEEFSISTAAQGAEQSGEGAVQIRFETKRGTNEFHGGAGGTTVTTGLTPIITSTI